MSEPFLRPGEIFVLTPEKKPTKNPVQRWESESRKKTQESEWMFPKIVGFPPKSSILIGIFNYKPSILGYPYFWKHPNQYTANRSFQKKTPNPTTPPENHPPPVRVTMVGPKVLFTMKWCLGIWRGFSGPPVSDFKRKPGNSATFLALFW